MKWLMTKNIYLFFLMFSAFKNESLAVIEKSLKDDGKIQEEKEMEVLDFKNIKKILQKDGLSEAAKRKEEELKVLKKEQFKVEKKKYFIPRESEMWGILSDFWLVKNAQILKWDFEKPDYGLELSFSNLMESLGFYQKKYRILLLDTTEVIRAAIPGDNELTLLISVPFMKKLDLSRLEISLLMLEDFIRLEKGYFNQYVLDKNIKKFLGTNFKGKKFNFKMINKMLERYSYFVFKKGYTFQEMFEVTQKMDVYLKSKPKLWNSYFQLLSRMDTFFKTNQEFQSYIKLFPSPEMQMKWLKPQSRVK